MKRKRKDEDIVGFVAKSVSFRDADGRVFAPQLLLQGTHCASRKEELQISRPPEARLRERSGQNANVAVTRDEYAVKPGEDQSLLAQRIQAIGHLAGGLVHDLNNLLGIIVCHTEIAKERLSPDHPINKNIDEIKEAAKRASTLIEKLPVFTRQQ